MPPWNQAAIAVVLENEPLVRAVQLARSAFLGETAEVGSRPSWAAPISKPHLSLAYVESIPSDDRSTALLPELTMPAPFVAEEAVLFQVSRPNEGASSVWEACQRGEWKEVARVSLV